MQASIAHRSGLLGRGLASAARLVYPAFMKIKIVGVSLALLSAALAAHAADSGAATNATKTNEVELLRKLLEVQKKNPNKVIHHPNQIVTAQATAPVKAPVTNSPPTNPPPTKSVQPVANPPAAKPAPAPSQAVQPISPPSPTAYTVPTNFPSYQELEDAYLNRQITARRFEEALKLLERHQKITEERKAAVNKLLQERGLQPPGSAAEQKKITDVENKMDELMRQKAQRDKASTNAPPAGPLTKRQRLDALLRQLIEGKITDAEYREKREKVLAEPD
jgi:hypothetical protein